MKRQLVSLGFAFSAMVALAGIADLAAAAEPMALKLGSTAPPWVGWGPLYIADEKGYFKDEDLEVKIIYIEASGPREAFDALAAKQIDGRLGTIDEGTLYWTPEAPFSVILATDVSAGGDGILIRKDRGISSIEELKGKTVALWLNTPSHLFFHYVLQQKGMSEEDVSLVDMPAEDAAAAVVAGNADAAVTWVPYLLDAAEDPNVEILVTSKEAPGLLVDVLMMRNDVLASNPEACQRLVRAWNKAVAFQKGNPEEGAAIMAKGLDFSTAEDVSKALAGGVALQGKEENAQLFGGTGPGTALGTARFAIDLWTELGRLTSPVKAEDLIDASCLEK